jgi:putative transposase
MAAGLTGDGRIGPDVPQGRQPCLDPQPLACCRRRWRDFDDKNISVRARGMSVRDLEGPGVSPALISAVADAAPDKVAAWQARPWGGPIRWRSQAQCGSRSAMKARVRTKAIRIALSVRAYGAEEIFGLWLARCEGAKFWLRVMNALRIRGMKDILMAVVDGFKCFPDAIRARVSRRHGPDLQCPSAARQPRFRQLQGPQIRRHGLERHPPRDRR